MCIFQAKTHTLFLPVFLPRFKIITALLLKKIIFQRKSIMKRIVTPEWHAENSCQLNS